MVTDQDITPRAWARLKEPWPIPDPLSIGVLEKLSDAELADLLRSNLLPGEGPAARRAHADLWAYLELALPLRTRATEILNAMADQAYTDLEHTELSEAHRRRIPIFVQRVEDMTRRLGRTTDTSEPGEAAESLVHLGPEYRRMRGLALRTVRELALAVAEHRAAITGGEDRSHVDHQLWAVLATLNLDPLAATSSRSEPDSSSE